MAEVNFMIDILERSPLILRDLLSQIPDTLYRVRRQPNKWSIHEQACHLIEAQEILIGRFQQFANEEDPMIRSYIPPFDRSEDHYLQLDLTTELDRFPIVRKEMVEMLRGYGPEYWERQGRHEVFRPYNTRLLLTHALNVDYVHFFSIEQLGLTKPGFEEEIMTLP